jgi:hypothetical protein
MDSESRRQYPSAVQSSFGFLKTQGTFTDQSREFLVSGKQKKTKEKKQLEIIKILTTPMFYSILIQI